jgi:hypothetical protein
MDQRPQSTQLAVAELKRYLPNPTHRIRLHDLLMAEVNRVIEQTHFPTGQPHPDPETLAQRLRDYEAAAVTLLALLVHAGYFADRPDHDDLLVAVLRRLASRPTEQGGYTIWVNAHQYPTMLALYALGLGCLASGQVASFAHALATIRLPVGSRNLSLGVAVSSWRVLDEGAMKALPDLERRQTPVSDYLHGRLRDCARPILPDDADYDRRFDELEYLLGVIFAHERGSGTGPIGRFVWRSRYSEQWPDEALVTHRGALLTAGLFDGSGDALDQTKTAYDEQLSRSGLAW